MGGRVEGARKTEGATGRAAHAKLEKNGEKVTA